MGLKRGFEFIKKYTELLSERYKKAHKLYEKIESMKEEEAISYFYEALKRINEKKPNLDDKEKIAILKILRYPYKFLKEITVLHKLSVKEGTNVLDVLGVNVKISPITLYVTLTENKDKITPTEYQALIFNTNHSWYEKGRAASILLAANLFLFRTKRFYNKSLLKVPDSMYDEIVKTVNNDPVFWKKRFIDYETGYDDPYPFEIKFMSLADSLEDQDFLLAIEKLKKENWGDGNLLVAQVEEILKRKNKNNKLIKL